MNIHHLHLHLHEKDEDLHLWFARVLAWRTRAQACLIHGPHFDSCFRRFLEFIFHFCHAMPFLFHIFSSTCKNPNKLKNASNHSQFFA
jgi:hypothetical protein